MRSYGKKHRILAKYFHVSKPEILFYRWEITGIFTGICLQKNDMALGSLS